MFFGDEIKFKSSLFKNGVSLSILDSVNDVTTKFDGASRCTVNRWLVYLRLPYIGSRGEGRPSNRLDLRIRQQLPARILTVRLIRGQLANTSGSSIVEHMINSRECVADFNDDRFSILSRSHSLVHLKVLGTLYVRSLQPSPCKQRDCLLGLNVISL